MTQRQQEIKLLLENGYTAAETARELGVSRNAIYQSIARMRRDGCLPEEFTPSGASRRSRVAESESLELDMSELLLGMAVKLAELTEQVGLLTARLAGPVAY